MAYTIYNCTAMIGGAARALDALAVASLSDGDRALVMDSNDQMIFFEFQSAATDAEDATNHPFKIRPDDYGAAGVWYEMMPEPIHASSGDVYITVSGTERMRFASAGNIGFGTDTPGTHFHFHHATAATQMYITTDAELDPTIWWAGDKNNDGTGTRWGYAGLDYDQAATYLGYGGSFGTNYVSINGAGFGINRAARSPLDISLPTDDLEIIDADEDGGDGTQFGNSTLPINGWIKLEINGVIHYILTTETEP